jgi:hypothetical protein
MAPEGYPRARWRTPAPSALPFDVPCIGREPSTARDGPPSTGDRNVPSCCDPRRDRGTASDRQQASDRIACISGNGSARREGPNAVLRAAFHTRRRSHDLAEWVGDSRCRGLWKASALSAPCRSWRFRDSSGLQLTEHLSRDRASPKTTWPPMRRRATNLTWPTFASEYGSRTIAISSRCAMR